jgi:hypothetical protein
MPETMKSRRLQALMSELKQANASYDRWITLGKRLKKTSDKGWKLISHTRQLQVKLLELLIDEVDHS